MSRAKKAARQRLGWRPTVTFRELVCLMVDADFQALLELRQCQDVLQEMRKQIT
jgi:GDP-D-mannose dehydratase